MKGIWWRYLIILLVLVLTGGLLWAFYPKDDTTPQTQADFPVTVGEVTLQEAPASVVSLSPGLTERIFELVDQKLVGRTNYCTQPQLAQIEPVGSLLNPDFSKLASLKPQLAVSFGQPTQATAKRLQELSITQMHLNAVTKLEDWQANDLSLCTLLLGNQSGKKAHQKLQGYLNKQLSRCDLHTKSGQIGLLWLVTQDMAATSDTLGGDMITQGGFVNLANGTNGAYHPETPLPETDKRLLVVDQAWFSKLPQTQQAIFQEDFDAIVYFDTLHLEQQNMHLPELYAQLADALDAITGETTTTAASSSTTTNTTQAVGGQTTLPDPS